MPHLNRRMALIMLMTPTMLCAATVPQLPTPGCYHVNWEARDDMYIDGQLQHTKTSQIDGATGQLSMEVRTPSGVGWFKQFDGSGPFFRSFRRAGLNFEMPCVATSQYDSASGFDIKVACPSATIDPAKLTFTRIPDPVEKWQIDLSVLMTSQIGLNTLPMAQNDIVKTLEAVLASAQPSTDAERKQLAEQRAQLEILKQQFAQNAPEMERLRAEMEALSQSGSVEEQKIAQKVLAGSAVQHQVRTTENWTWAGSVCPSN